MPASGDSNSLPDMLLLYRRDHERIRRIVNDAEIYERVLNDASDNRRPHSIVIFDVLPIERR
jgi:hypothetical protein